LGRAGGGELLQVDAQFRHQRGGCHLLHPRNCLQQLHGLLIGLQALLNLALQLRHGCFEKVDVRQDLAQQDVVIGLEPPSECLA